jgi:antitoxin VapB
MALSIKDLATDRLARRRPDYRRVDHPGGACGNSRPPRKREQRRRGKTIDRAQVDEIVRRIAALPIVDDRSPDELIGYDEHGLPS